MTPCYFSQSSSPALVWSCCFIRARLVWKSNFGVEEGLQGGRVPTSPVGDDMFKFDEVSTDE
jgi:hypothetical protein